MPDENSEKMDLSRRKMLSKATLVGNNFQGAVVKQALSDF
jgi:hypothetical protein